MARRWTGRRIASHAFRVRVKPDGARPFQTTLRRFLADNRGAFAVSTVKKLRRLRPGQEECFGGGAVGYFCVTRPGTKSHIGGYSKTHRKSRRQRRRSKRY